MQPATTMPTSATQARVIRRIIASASHSRAHPDGPSLPRAARYRLVPDRSSPTARCTGCRPGVRKSIAPGRPLWFIALLRPGHSGKARASTDGGRPRAFREDPERWQTCARANMPDDGGLLDLDGLGREVDSGEIDTVLVVMTDLYGRFMGKRLDAGFFLEGAARHGTHVCKYLLTASMEMDPVPGYRLVSWGSGYGDFQLVPDLGTLRIASWLDRTAIVLCDVRDEADHRARRPGPEDDAPTAGRRRRCGGLPRDGRPRSSNITSSATRIARPPRRDTRGWRRPAGISRITTPSRGLARKTSTGPRGDTWRARECRSSRPRGSGAWASTS